MRSYLADSDVGSCGFDNVLAEGCNVETVGSFSSSGRSLSLSSVSMFHLCRLLL